MSRRATSATAWTIGVVSLVISLAGLVVWAVTGGPLGSLSFPSPGIAIGFPLVGALIASRRPENPVGWVMLLVGLGGALTLASGVYGYAALLSRPSLPGEDWSYWVSSWVWTAAFVPLVTVLVPIFPDGRLPSRRWRAVVAAASICLVAIMAAGAVVDPIETPALDGRTVPNPLGVGWPAAWVVQGIAYAITLALMVVCVVGLVRRYRAARGVLRLQLSWFTYAFAVALAFLILNFMTAGGRNQPAVAVVAGILASAGFAFAAVGVGVAVLRYRLYDIGRVVNRTIVYALLTALLVGVYAIIVVGIGTALGRRSSPVLIAGATLFVAALAGPARRRIQTLIDRRFNRRRYDAERTLAEFGARLRDEVDVEELRRLLGHTADRTLQPERVRVWIRGVDS